MVLDALLFIPRMPFRILGEAGALARATPRLPRIERALTARAESADDRITRVGTAARALRRELTNVRKQIEPLDGRIVKIERAARPLEGRLAAIETATGPVQRRLSGLEGAIKRLADTLREVEGTFEPLDQRLTGLERTAADLMKGLAAARDRREPAEAVDALVGRAGLDTPDLGAGGRFARP